MVGVGREIVALAGVALEVEKERRQCREVYVLVALVADHGKGAIIQANTKLCLGLAVHNVAKIEFPMDLRPPAFRVLAREERAERRAVALQRYVVVQHVQDGWHDIDGLAESLDHAAPDPLGRAAGRTDDERNVNALIEVALLAEHPMVPKLFPVVAGEDDQGIVIRAATLEEADQSAQVMVEFGHKAIVGSAKLAHGPVLSWVDLGIEPLSGPVVAPHVGGVRMTVCLDFGRGGAPKTGYVVGMIEFVVGLGGDKGWVRAQQAQMQEPRPARLPGDRRGGLIDRESGIAVLGAIDWRR